ncbi:MAG: hypothetical protein ACFFEV_06890, partial [Candidatus Thorarchaeota archaeon]
HILLVEDFLEPNIESFKGPTTTVYCDDENQVWLYAFEEEDASLVSHGFINYSVDGETWIIAEMSLVNQTLDVTGEYMHAVLMGRLPLVYNTDVNYTVVCFDHAGNSAGSEEFKSTGLVKDTTAPIFLYSRVIGAEPALNGSIVARFYEPENAAGVDEVNVSIKFDSIFIEYRMTYNPETDTWVFHLPVLNESTQIQYKFEAWDKSSPRNHNSTEIMTYLIQSFSASVYEGDTGRLVFIENANSVGHYRVLFRVETAGYYGLVPVCGPAIANLTMWLDGQYVPNGAQVHLFTNVHILLVKVETGDMNGFWGMKLVSMRSEIDSCDGVLSFNSLAPAPSPDEIGLQSAWASGLMNMETYVNHYTHHDVDYIDGDFEFANGTSWWHAWDHNNAAIVDGGYESQKSVNLYDSAAGWISFDYPTGTYTSGISFLSNASIGTNMEILVSFQFTNKEWYNKTMTLDGQDTWERTIVSIPHEEIELIQIKYLDSNSPGSVLIDKIALITYRFTESSWDTSMCDDISPHNILGVESGFVSVDYALYTEFISDCSLDGNLSVLFGSTLVGVNITLYFENQEIATLSDSGTVPISIAKGINRIAAYVQSEDATDDFLTISVTSAGEPVEIDVLGQGSGLLTITAEGTSVYVPFIDGEWTTPTLENIESVTIDEPENTMIDLDVAFSEDDGYLVVARNNTRVDIRPAPILYAVLDSNNTGLSVMFRAELRSMTTMETVWCGSEWFDISEGTIIVDLTTIAAEIYGTTSTEYGFIENFEVWIRDNTDDGIAPDPQQVAILPMMKSRVGEICKLSRYVADTSTEFNDFELVSDLFTFNDDAFHGYGSASIGGVNGALELSVGQIESGTLLRFAADTTLDIIFECSFGSTTRNLTVTIDDYSRVSSEIAGWNIYEIDVYNFATMYAKDYGFSLDITLDRVIFDSSVDAKIDSIKIDSTSTTIVGIPYWNTELEWDANKLGFSIKTLDDTSVVNVPEYSIEYDGVVFSTADSDWYNIISTSASIHASEVIVEQVAYAHFLTITDTYTILASGHIDMERSVSKFANSSLFNNEKLLTFEYDVEKHITDYYLDSSNDTLYQFEGILSYSIDTSGSPDIDDAEENLDGPYFSRDMSETMSADDYAGNYQSDGDILRLVPEENTDTMWIRYTGLSISDPYDNYLVFRIDTIKGADGYVKIVKGSSTYEYPFTEAGIHSIGLPTSEDTITSIEIGAVNATISSVLGIDWLSIRNKALVLDNDRANSLLPTRNHPDLVEPFDTLDNWEHNDRIDGSTETKAGIESGYLVMY